MGLVFVKQLIYLILVSVESLSMMRVQFYFLTGLLSLTTTSCDNSSSNNSVYNFHTNGKIFLLSIFNKQSHPELHIFGKDGKLRKVFEGQRLATAYPYIHEEHIYFVAHDPVENNSYLRMCDIDFKNCRTLLEMSGAIRYPIVLNNTKILFLRSPFNSSTHRKSGYANFRIYIYDPDQKRVTKLNNEIFDKYYFSNLGPVVKINNKVVFRGFLVAKSSEFIRSIDSVFIDQLFEAKISNENIVLNEINNELIDKKQLYLKYKINNKNIYYLATTGKNSKYNYQVCIKSINVKQYCENNENFSSYPIVVGGVLYYFEQNSNNTFDIKRVRLME